METHITQQGEGIKTRRVLPTDESGNYHAAVLGAALVQLYVLTRDIQIQDRHRREDINTALDPADTLHELATAYIDHVQLQTDLSNRSMRDTSSRAKMSTEGALKSELGSDYDGFIDSRDFVDTSVVRLMREISIKKPKRRLRRLLIRDKHQQFNTNYRRLMEELRPENGATPTRDIKSIDELIQDPQKRQNLFETISELLTYFQEKDLMHDKKFSFQDVIWTGTPSEEKFYTKLVKHSSIQRELKLGRQVRQLEARNRHLNNPQIKVEETDYALGGKYSAVCKLEIKYYSSKWNKSPQPAVIGEASGWLYNDTTVVTAGHCVFSNDSKTDDEYGETYAVDIDVYLGYNPSGHSERRKGTGIIVHRSWYEIQDSRCDIAVIRLEKSFTTGKPFNVKNPTPTLNGENLCIVGYPSDVPPLSRESKNTAGKVMYQSNWNTTFEYPEKGLRYRADTAPGNSGSPVLLQGGVTDNSGTSLSAIAVHAFGEAGGCNGATLLGYNGNRLRAFATGFPEDDQQRGGEITSDGKPVVSFFDLINVP
ncbi:hypothetical protein N7471_001541 [Penicillium samsonianum]|uniref:uncharacterized protein n=1 Tax=Penicillium samsonianum TaxID=1882272 RepID=UPI00254667F2|nr:uncharacterized protein N7471_001541 [Penicillium samsonianum]KAJ6150342.1 hypothetical protein N7471_001541 [Penicillium samsonianum]